MVAMSTTPGATRSTAAVFFCHVYRVRPVVGDTAFAWRYRVRPVVGDTAPALAHPRRAVASYVSGRCA